MKEFDLNEFRKEVTKLDMGYGVTLNDPTVFKNPEEQFILGCVEYKNYLDKVIKLLNGIDPEQKVRNIAEASCLRWKENIEYSVDSIEFRARFLTLFLTEISAHIAELCEKEFQVRKQATGIYEQPFFYLLDIRERINRFVMLFLDGNSWRKLVLTMAEFSYLIRIDSKKRVSKLINGTNHMVQELRKGTERLMAGSMALDESILVQYLMQLSLLMCGGYTENLPLPRFKSFANKTPGVDSYQYEIAYIGKAILFANEKNQSGALMFQVFKDASPKLVANFREMRLNLYLQIGVTALTFVNFILNDKNVDKLVQKIVKNEQNRWVW